MERKAVYHYADGLSFCNSCPLDCSYLQEIILEIFMTEAGENAVLSDSDMARFLLKRVFYRVSSFWPTAAATESL